MAKAKFTKVDPKSIGLNFQYAPVPNRQSKQNRNIVQTVLCCRQCKTQYRYNGNVSDHFTPEEISRRQQQERIFIVPSAFSFYLDGTYECPKCFRSEQRTIDTFGLPFEDDLFDRRDGETDPEKKAALQTRLDRLHRIHNDAVERGKAIQSRLTVCS